MLKKLKQTALGSLKTAGAYTLVRKSRWRQGRLLILAYHGISLEDEHEWDPDLFMPLPHFRARLQMLKQYGCNVLPLNEALERLYADDLPEDCVVLTFDDGYYNFYRQALPLLKEFNFPATLYLTTYCVQSNRPAMDAAYPCLLWKGRHTTLDLQPLIGEEARVDLATREARTAVLGRLMDFIWRHELPLEEQEELAARLARQLKVDYEALWAKRVLHLLAPAEVKQLAAEGIDIQLHTHHHHSPLQRELFNREIEENRACIQSMTGTAAAHFCYPRGLYSEAFFRWLEELNIRSATTCEPGFATRDTPRLLLPRLVDHTVFSSIEFEGWLTGVAAFMPRRQRVYNQPLTAGQ